MKKLVILIITILALAIGLYLATSNANKHSVVINGYRITVPRDFTSEKISEDTYRIVDSKSGSYINIKLENNYPDKVEIGMYSSDKCIKVFEECIKLSFPSVGSKLDYYQIIEYDDQSNPSLDVRNNVDLNDTYYGVKYIEKKYTRDYSSGNYFIKRFSMLGYEKVSVSLAINREGDYIIETLLDEFAQVLENMIKAQK